MAPEQKHTSEMATRSKFPIEEYSWLIHFKDVHLITQPNFKDR